MVRTKNIELAKAEKKKKKKNLSTQKILGTDPDQN